MIYPGIQVDRENVGAQFAVFFSGNRVNNGVFLKVAEHFIGLGSSCKANADPLHLKNTLLFFGGPGIVDKFQFPGLIQFIDINIIRKKRKGA
jgi:hypothetical protein